MSILYRKINHFIDNRQLSRQQLKEIFVTAVVYLTIDLFYINSKKIIFSEFFKQVQKPLVIRKFAAFLLIYSLLLVCIFFIIKDRKNIIYAFLFGLFVYGVYDLTNYATLKNWTFEFVLKDTLWGGIVFALSTFIIYEIIKKLTFYYIKNNKLIIYINVSIILFMDKL